MTTKKILAIPGSTRTNSSNMAILHTIRELCSDECVLDIYTEIDQLPHFHPNADDEHIDPQVEALRKRIAESDAVIVCTPEYVFSLPSVLKNALEWTVSTTVFTGKPVAFVVASASGQKAFESLDLILSTLTQVQIEDNLKLLIKGGQKFVSEDGRIVDPEKIESIRQIVDDLIACIE